MEARVQCYSLRQTKNFFTFHAVDNSTISLRARIALTGVVAPCYE